MKDVVGHAGDGHPGGHGVVPEVRVAVGGAVLPRGAVQVEEGAALVLLLGARPVGLAQKAVAQHAHPATRHKAASWISHSQVAYVYVVLRGIPPH